MGWRAARWPHRAHRGGQPGQPSAGGFDPYVGRDDDRPRRQWLLGTSPCAACGLADMLAAVQAIEKCRSGKIDIVLMDWKLNGDVDGVEAARRIRANEKEFSLPHVHILGVTGAPCSRWLAVCSPVPLASQCIHAPHGPRDGGGYGRRAAQALPYRAAARRDGELCPGPN